MSDTETLVTWPDGLTTRIDPGPFAVVPAQVKALSKAGKAWFAATARNAGAWPKRCAVRQDLADLKAAFKDAETVVRDPVPLTEREEWALVCKITERRETIERANGGRWPGWSPDHWIRREHSAYLVESRTVRSASWFAFDEMGRIVLSLRTSREDALRIAVAYNAAGGRLVLLSPEPVLADAALEDCAAIPDTVPGEPPARDPKDAALEAFGDVVETTGGRIAIMGEGGVAATLIDSERRAQVDGRHPYFQVPNPGEVIADLLVMQARVVHDGKPSALPPTRRVKGLDVVSFDGHLFQRRYVAAVVKGAKRVRVELSTDGTVLRVHRDDGLVGCVMVVRP